MITVYVSSDLEVLARRLFRGVAMVIRVPYAPDGTWFIRKQKGLFGGCHTGKSIRLPI